MRPVLLEMNQLMAYREASISFEGLGLTGLCGSNGDGKSTAIEAIPFALWGHCRYRSADGPGLDRLIRHGAEGMSVSLTFRAGGHTYRVKRSVSRKSGQALEFYRTENGAEVPLTAGKIKDTQALINAAVGMDLATFSASSLLLQGQSGTFTAGMDDKGRKQMLSDILDLALYPRLKEGANEKVRTLEGKLQAQRERLAVLDQVPASIADGEASLAARTQERTEASQALATLRGELAAAEEAVKAAEALSVRARDLERQVATLDEEHRVALEEVERRHSATVARRRQEVEQAQGVEMAAVVERGKAARIAVNEKQSLLNRLAERRVELERDIAAIPTVPPLLVQNLTLNLRAMDTVAEQAEAWRVEQREILAKVAGLKHDHGIRLSNARTALKYAQEQAGKLSADVECLDLPRARCRFMGDANDAAARLPELTTAVAVLEAENTWADGEARWNELDRSLADLRYTKKAHDALRAELEAARVNEARADQRSTLLRQLNEAEEETRELRAALPMWQDALKALLDEAAALKSRHADTLAQLETFFQHEANDEKHRLRTAYEGKRVPLVWDLEEVREAWRGKSNGSLVGGIRYDIDEKERALSVLDRDLGALEARLQHLREQLSEGEALREKVASLAAEVGEWQLLARMVGDKGIPVELMRTAIPELEARANGWLSRLTGGGMSIALVTEVDLKKGGEKDVLRVDVTHDGHTQPYAGFSGGQRARIDMALRLSLSELLAARRGAKLECLIFDEASAPLDASGRDAYLEILEACAREFPFVLVVSHSADVTSRLPACLEVVKQGDGSVVRRAA